MSVPPVTYDDADEVFRTAELVLENIRLTYQQYSEDLPARQFIIFGGRGDTPHDCEQVSVSIEQVYTGLPGSQANEPQPCDAPKTVVFVVEVVRCIPTPTGKTAKPPTPEAITEHARKQGRDAMILMESASNAVKAQQFGGSVYLADVMSGQPQGGMQAMVLNLIMPVFAGYGV